MKCEVCGRIKEDENNKVISSTLGPVSFNTCFDCLNHHAEPLTMLTSMIVYSNMEELTDMAEWCHHLTFFEEGEYKSISIIFDDKDKYLKEARELEEQMYKDYEMASDQECDTSINPFEKSE